MGKRGAQGAGTIRQRKDGRWEARYTVGRDPGTGKQVQKSVYGKTQAEVRKKLQAVTMSIDTGFYLEPTRLTVGQWLEIWLSEYCGNLKPSSMHAYSVYIKTHLIPNIGAIKLNALNAHTVQKLYNSIDRAPRTVAAIHGVLHSALAQAVELGYISTNVAGACKLPRAEVPEIHPLDEKQTVAFLETIKGHKYERLFKVALFTGMRQSELIGLVWDCVDFNKGTILIRQQIVDTQGRYFLSSPKSDKPRTITPAPEVMQMLREQRKTQMEWRLMAGTGWEFWQGHELVFTNEIGNHIIHTTLRRHLKRIVTALGLPGVRFHDLRHTYAVASIKAGDDIKTLQQNMGHHSAAFTLDKYGHVTEQMKKDSATRMQMYIDTMKK